MMMNRAASVETRHSFYEDPEIYALADSSIPCQAPEPILRSQSTEFGTFYASFPTERFADGSYSMLSCEAESTRAKSMSDLVSEISTLDTPEVSAFWKMYQAYPKYLKNLEKRKKRKSKKKQSLT
jgi:hypothetical protein